MTSWPTRIAAILIALCFGMVPPRAGSRVQSRAR